MKNIIPLNKKSKKAQKRYHAQKRRIWDNINPVTKIIPNKKAYSRQENKKVIQKEQQL